MSVITISRQLGSHGGRVARALSRKLGWKFADKATINGVIEQYGLVRLDTIYGERVPSFWEMYREDSYWTIEWMNKTIEAIAAEGDVVILGRGAFSVLSGYSDALNVLITAPMDVRAHRIALRDDITEAEAEVKIKADDKTRRRFTKRIYSADWADPNNFDLVLDTGEMSDEAAVGRVIAALQEKQDKAGDGRRTADIEVDSLLRESIRSILQ